ncbi:MAG: NADH-quinone oxidoreductase subunit N [Acidobacteriota bacterium]|nr:NADH-quinone oxidoreductase subunit N [Acidobacteriota bacterium]
MTLTLGTPLVTEGIVAALAVLVLVTGLVRSGTDRAPSAARTIAWITFVGLLGALATTFAAADGSVFGGAYVVDGLALFAKRLVVGSAAISVLASLSSPHGALTRRAAEYHFTLLFSLLGMLVLVSARELILLFVAFELMSIPLYVLTGFLKRDGAAPEAALKFFVVGTVSAAVIAYGMSFMYGVMGTTLLAAVPAATAEAHPLMLLGLGLVLAGLGFKIAAFPFHMWAPDSYEAASTPFVAWLSVAPKAAGFVVIIRLYVEGAGPAALAWVPLLSMLAGVTIVAGNLMAIPQQNVKRLLAYSGVAHIGYMLIGLAAMSADGVATVLFYLLAYVFGNMGAFLVVEAVARAGHSNSLDAYRGLAQRSPLLALAMLLFLLSLGGIPFVAGFWAKLYVFLAGVERGLLGLVFVGAVLTVVALYYYLLVARRMYIEPPPEATPVPVSPSLGITIAVCVLGVVGIGVYPGPWLDVARRIASTLF